MVNVESNGLHHLEQLLYVGKFSEAFEFVKHLEKKVEFLPTEQLQFQVLKSDLLRRVGQFRNALSLADKAFQESQKLIEPLYGIDALLIKLKIHLMLFQPQKASELINRTEKLLLLLSKPTSADITQRKATVMWCKAGVYWMNTKVDQALECAQESLVIREQVGNKSAIADSLDMMGDIFDEMGELSRPMEYYQRALTLREEIGNRQEIAISLDNVGLGHFMRANFQQASACFEKSLVIHTQIGNKYHISHVLFHLGWMARFQGELKQALIYFNQHRANAEAIGFPTFASLIQIGLIYGLQGEIDQALEYIEQGITERGKLFSKSYRVAWALNRLAKLYREKGDLEQATKHLTKSLALSDKWGNVLAYLVVKSETLFYLFSIALDQNFLNRAHEYLERLQEICEHMASFLEKTQLFDNRYRVAKAMILNTSPRIKDKVNAQELLQEVAKDEVTDHDLVVTALLILCDLLLVELRMSGVQDVLDEIQSLTTQLLTIAKQQPSYWVLAETYVLKSRLAMFELDLTGAQQLLDQALLLTEEKGLKKLAVKIFSEQTQFQNQMNQWKRLIEQDASLSERLELAQLESLILRMTNRQLEVTEEETLAYAQRAQQMVKGWETR
ncbi:MAG: tetratricopeptide repeat protein [Candidatus Hodarchaeales archaeon]